MYYLAIDTSNKNITAFVGGDKTVVRFTPDCALSHSVVLMDEIEKCLAQAEIQKEDIDFFCCSLGPGSFTGIRIGVATTKAFAYALGKKVVGVTSFECLAYNVESKRKKLAVIDARHDNYYASGFDENGKVIVEPRFIDISAVKEYSKDFLIVSDIAIDGVDCVVADVKDGFIKAVASKISEAQDDVETLVPLYVKKSQAEEEL